MAAKPKELTFEQALQKLEQTVQAIEQGQVGLEESIKRHEEGMALIKLCRSKLSEAERRIQQLQLADDGTLTSEAFADVPTEAVVRDSDAE